jgi:hypothetical protein
MCWSLQQAFPVTLAAYSVLKNHLSNLETKLPLASLEPQFDGKLNFAV